MDKVTITIDGQKITVPSHYTVLEACKEAGINIPTLCYLKDISQTGSCRMCLVEVKGARNLQASCVYPVSEGMEVFTNTPKVRKARKGNLELILSNHEKKCLSCVRSYNCELQKLAKELQVDETTYAGENIHYPLDDLSPSIVRDPNKCILCRRCIAVCKNVQTTAVIQASQRGFKTVVGPVFDKSLNEVPCIMCGQCISVCPVGALREKSEIEKVWDALAEKDRHVIVQTAPAVRVALGEEFGMPIGTRVTGKMVAALKRLGFDKVVDTDTAADLTIMEEGYELLDRLENGGKLPMITSCSPGWIKFCEHFFPDFLDHLSSCKSPHMMLGAILKSYYAEKMGMDPEKIFVVSVMPCTAKKYEAERPEMNVNGLRDVDAVITTRELAQMIKEARIDFVQLEEETFDDPLGEASGAGVIFGATGGVMEAALRTVAEKLTGTSLDEKELEFQPTRGFDGIKEFTVDLPQLVLKGAVVHGTGNARKLLEKIRAGQAEYHFIEVMGCPGGCITGGGQPIVDAKTRMDIDVYEERAKALYEEDRSMVIRKSHENPFIIKLYEEFLEKPLSHKSHELLHTTYSEKENYPCDCKDC
ncbi:MAG: 2Fe-2S iron-sulfur cluster binding domain-containing protein [Epulopiscium sp.]|nr:2Fe-2S iron-sulfur cluster binding domain-containing protein [Candidatus Epulonipiscium sp.]